MIPTHFEYYNRRAREHQTLAERAADAEQRTMHERLVDAYQELAQRYRARPKLTIKV